MVQLCEYDVLYSIVLLTERGAGGRLTNKNKWGGEGKKYNTLSTKNEVLMEWKFINSVTIQLGGEGNQNFRCNKLKQNITSCANIFI